MLQEEGSLRRVLSIDSLEIAQLRHLDIRPVSAHMDMQHLDTILIVMVAVYGVSVLLHISVFWPALRWV